MARSRQVKRGGGKRPAPAPEELPSDDEIEKFHRAKDKLSLEVSEDELSEGSLEVGGPAGWQKTLLHCPAAAAAARSRSQYQEPAAAAASTAGSGKK